jgi:hypothetical protein
VLDDGCTFVLVEIGPVGWWFKARAQDGRSSVEGNLRLAWDGTREAWYPQRRH